MNYNDTMIPTTIDNATMKLLAILAIILITFIMTRLVAYVMHHMKRFNKDMTAIYLIRDIISYIIYFAALMTILQFFGINLAGTLLSLGIVGIAVTFAAKDIISNLFSGIILILGRSVKVGDTIEINGKKGYVERISLRSTIIIDDYGVKNHIPNSILTNNEYLEYKDPEVYRVDIIAGLPLNIDNEEFMKYIIKKMESYPEISDNPKPNVFSKEISFKQSKFKVSFWVKNFNDKDKYKIIITNDIRKYIQTGENDE
ncbi:mechanosensitive ion channel family protein [Methanobrevibacter sp.]